jgi:tripartite-type tricarboxylate transporter receptor subunit TctC
MTKKLHATVAVGVWVGMLALLCATERSAAAAERDLAQYFKGKSITVNVGSAPGGGHDVNSRLWAKFGQKHIPGNPRMIVKNIPGGGGARALRTTFSAAPDGFTMANLAPRWPTLALLGDDTGIPNFKLETLLIIGSPVNVPVPRLVCSRSDVAKSWREVLALKKPLTFGSGEQGGTSNRPVELLQLIRGEKSPFRVVHGYDGIAESMAAFDRGEVNGIANCSERDVPRLFPEWVKQRRFAPLFWWDGPSDPNYLEQLGVTPKELPHFLELPGVELSKEQLTVFETANALGRFTRAMVLPPGVPGDIVRGLQEAYRKTMQDPEFIQAMETAGYDVGYGDPKNFRQIMDAARTLSPQGKDLFRKLLGVQK